MGWIVRGHTVGNYMVITKAGPSKGRGTIRLTCHDMALDADDQRGMDADTHSDVVDIDDGSDTEFEAPQT